MLARICKVTFATFGLSLLSFLDANCAQFDKSIAELSQHIKGRPGEGRYCIARAAYELADGKTEEAFKDAAVGLQDSATGTDCERLNQLAFLIMCLCTERSGDRASEESLLAQSGGNFSGKSWPYPLIKLFSGRLSENAVKAPDALGELEKQFILGMRRFVKNDRTAESFFLAASKSAAVQSPQRDFILIARKLSATSATAAVPAGETAGYKTYVNARYKYAIDYPTFFSIGSESENGDGCTFASKQKNAELRAWGMQLYGTVDGDAWTIAKLASEQTKYYQTDSAPPAQITYKANGKDWLVLSGLKEGRIFYFRALLATDGVKCFEITYPESAKAAFDPIVSRLAHSLRNSN